MARQDPGTKVLKRTEMQNVHILLILVQVRWTGHVNRIPDERVPKKILYGEQQVGKRSLGSQKKRHKDILKASLKALTNQHSRGNSIGSSKVARPHRKGSGEYEARLISEAEQKHAQREAKAKSSPTELSSSDILCSICARLIRAKICLISHLRTHIQEHVTHLIRVSHCQ